MTSVLIRRARTNDGKKFLTLVRALAEFERLSPPTRAAERRLLNDTFGAKKRFDVFLAWSGNEAVGYAIVLETYSSFLARPTLYLEDLFVTPKYRNKKIGLKLFRRCMTEAKKRKCGRMEWTVLDWNRGARRFYKKQRATHLKEWCLYRISF